MIKPSGEGPGGTVRRRLRQLTGGLRGRVVLGFGIVSAVVATTLAVTAWLLVSRFLIDQRARAAVRVSNAHAATLDAGLQQPDPDVPELLDNVQLNPASSVFLRYRDQWYGGVPPSGTPPIPAELAEQVLAGTAATQRVVAEGELLLAVGVPLPRSGGAFFELFSLQELNETLQSFAIALVVAVIALSLVNTIVGWLATRVALRPLRELTAVAAAVAAGNLDARIPDEQDPDLRGLTRSFNQTTDALQQRVAADARFAGDVSHELRTPLTTMINSMQIIQNRKAELPPTVLEPLDLLADDLERFRRLVVDMIEISRHDSGAIGELETVIVAELVTEAADQAAGRVVTTVSSEAARVSMTADKRRLERVFANLVENAERHGGGCQAVTVTADDTHVHVDVDDAGDGVPENRRARIFERFARNPRDAGSGSGVGLGLAIVERHVQWHGGTVVVVDRPGGGARFTVTLPIHGADQS